MSLDKKTIIAQEQLAQYCRDGKILDIEGASTERLPHYRRLVFNVMFGLIEKAFPITKDILGHADFKKLVEVYMTHHDAQVPQVWRVPGEFYSYFKEHPPKLIDDYPYLIELLELEWIEILVYCREDRISGSYEKVLPKFLDKAVVNPDFDILDFEYPVFKGNWDGILEKKSHYKLLVFRDVEEFKVHFLEITALYVVLIEALRQGLSIENAILESLEKYKLTETEGASDQLMYFISKLYDQGFILGRAN